MAGLAVPPIYQESPPPEATTSKPNKVDPESLIFASEEPGLEQIVSVEAGIDSDDDDSDSNPPVMTQAMRRQKSLQLAALCMAVSIAGGNDALIGPLIPRLQQVYRVSDPVDCHQDAPDNSPVGWVYDRIAHFHHFFRRTSTVHAISLKGTS